MGAASAAKALPENEASIPGRGAGGVGEGGDGRMSIGDAWARRTGGSTSRAGGDPADRISGAGPTGIAAPIGPFATGPGGTSATGTAGKSGRFSRPKILLTRGNATDASIFVPVSPVH